MECVESDMGVVGLLLNYRESERTVRCVDNLFLQGVMHVVVVDNSDDQGKSYASLQATYAANPHVSLLNGQSNLGFAAGVNLGVDWIRANIAACRYVLLLNNDAVMLEDGVHQLVAALENATGCVIAFPLINNNGKIQGKTYAHRLTGLLSSRKLPGAFFHCSGCCILVALHRLSEKLFDERFFMYGEDMELGWRMGEARMVFVPKILVFHEGSVSSKMGSPFYEQSLVVAHLKLIDKISKNKFDFVVLWIARVAMLACRAIVRSVRFKSIIPLRCFLSGLFVVLM
jgi:N-acetylglucosaminyl-diphospho-decaprenol L-rhamnosyltransferase